MECKAWSVDCRVRMSAEGSAWSGEWRLGIVECRVRSGERKV